MNNKKIITCLFVGALIGIAVPFDLLASTDAFYTSVNEQAEIVEGVVMGPALKIVCTFGAALGIGYSFTTRSPMPIIICVTIALIGGLLPKIINSLYTVSTMLLP